MVGSTPHLFNHLGDFNIFFGVCFVCSTLKKLSDENLAKQPDEVFDIICKIGRG